MKVKIEALNNDRVFIRFVDLTKLESMYMKSFVNNSTDFVENQKQNEKTFKTQFAGQGVIRYNGFSEHKGSTTQIIFESPYTYKKEVYSYSWKERLKILFTGKL